MNTKSLIIISLLFLITCKLRSQNNEWSLKACIEYALEHNIEVKQSKNDIKSLQIERKALKNSNLPDLTGEVSNKYDFGRSLNRYNSYEDTNINSTSFSLSTEVSLFSGFKVSASLAQNKFNLLAAEANTELIKDNLSLKVTSSYFQILLYKEIYKIAEEQIALTRGQEDKTKALVQDGKSSESQLYDVRAQLADDKLVATEAKNSLRLAYLDLLQLMELRDSDGFDVTALEELIDSPNGLDLQSIYFAAIDCLPQIQKSYYLLQSSSKNIKVMKSGYYPKVSLGAGLSSGYYNSANTVNENISQQLRNNMQKSIYATVSIPLFDRFSTRDKVRSARIEEDNARLNLENEKLKLYKEIEKAYMDAISAFEKYKSTSEAVLANQEAHRYALEKYDSGKSTVFEYNEIKMKLANALSQQSQAKYTFLLKRKILEFYSCQSLVD